MEQKETLKDRINRRIKQERDNAREEVVQQFQELTANPEELTVLDRKVLKFARGCLEKYIGYLQRKLEKETRQKT